MAWSCFLDKGKTSPVRALTSIVPTPALSSRWQTRTRIRQAGGSLGSRMGDALLMPGALDSLPLALAALEEFGGDALSEEDGHLFGGVEVGPAVDDQFVVGIGFEAGFYFAPDRVTCDANPCRLSMYRSTILIRKIRTPSLTEKGSAYMIHMSHMTYSYT
jgi:hypothetical protein